MESNCFDEVEFKPYPVTVSPPGQHVPNHMDDGQHEFVPYESVAKFLMDDNRNHFAADSIGEFVFVCFLLISFEQIKSPVLIEYVGKYLKPRKILCMPLGET